MKMRAPSIPLITVDPYFSVWSHDNINEQVPYHWTGSPNTILGTINVDGSVYRFLGQSEDLALPQTNIEITALSTIVTYANDKIRLSATFTSPMLVTDLYYASRPVSYLKLHWESLDGQNHTVTARIVCSEEFVLDKRGQSPVEASSAYVPGACCIRLGNKEQHPLNRCGDNVRIDWGYFYLAAKSRGSTGTQTLDGMDAIYAETPVMPEALFAFAYDDIDSIIYFGEKLKAFWRRDGKTICEAISESLREYDSLEKTCNAFSASIYNEAYSKGGEAYAHLTSLAYRQIMAAHKLVTDTEGNNLYISKECFSNGCAATVDVTYPSAPLFLRYNTELLKSMLRPIFRYARSDAWTYDFAPHDVGCYPILNGQVYFENKLENQMPIEECGNMLILMAAICNKEGNASFARDNMPLLSMWSDYLIQYGEDPGNQLCTDDFAGHLSHNCNLSIKAIMGLAGYSQILRYVGRTKAADKIMETAKCYAKSFCERSANSDGSHRLAYDQDGTFSLKYNAVWDKLWGTKLFPQEFYSREMERYHREAMPFGVPLDNRMPYTKSDWLHWVACMGSHEDFTCFMELLWNAYHNMDRRAPMCDWYFADSAMYKGFRHRSVQGGLFMRFLFD